MKRIISFILTLTVFLAAAVCIAKESLREEMEIYEKTLRLHIPANSDSEEDQALKLMVRNEVLKLLEEPLKNCKTREEAVRIVQEMQNEIKLTADHILAKNEKSYVSKVSIITEHYPQKDYGELSLPAGNYTSLKIELGKAEGKNWWCVLFPQVCVGTAKPQEALAQVGFTASQIKLLTEHEDYEYTVKFKLVEILENILSK